MTPDRPRIRHIPEGSFAAVVRAYQRSEKFAKLRPGTQKSYLRVLALAERENGLGGLSVHVIRPSLVQAFLDGLADRPGAQRTAQSVLKAVEKWAMVRDLLPYPITTGTEAPGTDGGHEPWSDAQVELAERHARPDLARIVTLMVHTGQRGSDIVRMRWSDIEDSDGHQGVNVVQQKTGRRLWIPLPDELRAALATWERRPPFFLVLNPFSGEAYTRSNLSWHWNKERDTKPELVPLAGLALHGLRATCVVRLRKRGATELQIENMVGMSAPMVRRYCRLADQRTMALAAVVHLNAGAPVKDKGRKAE
jgi:integrase